MPNFLLFPIPNPNTFVWKTSAEMCTNQVGQPLMLLVEKCQALVSYWPKNHPFYWAHECSLDGPPTLEGQVARTWHLSPLDMSHHGKSAVNCSH